MRRVSWALLAVPLLAASAGAGPPADSRFFGTYCGDADIRVCVTVRVTFLGFQIDERRECRTVELRNVRAQLDHLDTPQGGLISGRGTARIDGESTAFVIAGAVLDRGRARGTATVGSLRPHAASARLDSDGLGLTLRAYGNRVRLRKDGCGNRPPTAAITSPATDTSVPFGTSRQFAATATDVEDTTFPKERLRWESSRDGLIGTGRVFSTTQLSPGPHTVTFLAIDSGGMTATDSVRVTVTNEPPNLPVIVQPEPANTIVATGEVFLEGKAHDNEDGMLEGSALRWSSRPEASAVFQPRGTGRRVVTAFADPGTHIVRLTAVDVLGASRFVERAITVQPFTGNTPPRVSIIAPSHLGLTSGVAALTNPVTLLAAVNDLEDPTSALDLRWIADPDDPTRPDIEFGTGSTAPSVTLPTDTDGAPFYRITLRATDSGGLRSETSIRLLILSSPVE
jgi:hypothetical protein